MRGTNKIQDKIVVSGLFQCDEGHHIETAL